MENNDGFLGNSEKQDLFTEESYELNQYVYATQGQRFVNWLIDNLLLRFGLSYLTGMALGLLLALIAPDFLNQIALDQALGKLSFGFWVLAYLIGILNYIVYYTLCEKLFKGYTLGKIISGTRAIRQDGQELTFKDALLDPYPAVFHLKRLVDLAHLHGMTAGQIQWLLKQGSVIPI